MENVRPLETDRQRTEPQDHDLRDATDELVSLRETGLPSPDSRTSLSQRFQFFMLLEGSGGLGHLLVDHSLFIDICCWSVLTWFSFINDLN